MKKILLVEDDQALAIGIEYSLKQEGYTVEHVTTVKESKLWANQLQNDDSSEVLALLDVMLPDGTGFEVLSYFKECGIDIPVIFLTAMSEEINIVQGLDLGADDYITKPFRVKELLSRIHAVMRRSYHVNEKENANIISYKDILIDKSQAKVYKVTAGTKHQIDLSPTEYRILLYFFENKGITLSRKMILERLFGDKGNFIDDNALSVYIKRLREKIEDTDKDNPLIKTIRGLGYILE